MDLFSRPLPGWEPERHPLPAHRTPPALAAGEAATIARALLSAERPLIYVGGGLGSADGRAALTALAEHLDSPIVHSLMAKGTVPDDHPLLLGMPGFWGTESTNGYALSADVVLAIGTRFAETDASSWDPAYTWRFPPSRLIQIDIDAAEIGRNYPVEIGVAADAAVAVRAIVDAARDLEPGGRDRPDLRRDIAAARSALFADSAHRGRSDRFPAAPGADPRRPAGRAARRRDPRDRRSAGTRTAWRQCYPLPARGRFITPGGASTMGFGPAAPSASNWPSPDRVVVALVGDGA
jgi:acetolactate synthase-1/2/3 large subunit